MFEEEIETLRDLLLEDKSIYFLSEGKYHKCTFVKMDWLEKFGDNDYSDIAEPAVFFEDGTCAALYNCDSSQFKYFKKVFES